MTPEEAREHLAWPEGKDHPKVRDGSGRTWFEVQAGESHPYWNRLPDAPYEDAVMYAVAQGALATIAGMRAQYGVEVQRANGDWLPPYSWHDSPEQARTCVTALHVRHAANRRLVRRYVTEPEEA